MAKRNKGKGKAKKPSGWKWKRPKGFKSVAQFNKEQRILAYYVFRAARVAHHLRQRKRESLAKFKRKGG